MTYLHYSEKILEKVKTKNPALESGRHAVFKPWGFWLSVGDAWKEWCEGVGFRLSHLAYVHEVTLKPHAEILHLACAGDVDLFASQFRKTHDGLNCYIDWAAVAKKYQGILVDPYFRWLAMEPEHTWYYGWDVPSACVWDADAVNSVKLIV